MTKRHVVAMAIAAFGLVAPVSGNAASPVRSVVETAGAHQSAARTGVLNQTVTTTTLPPPPPSSDEAQQILTLVNAERTSRGLQPLQLEVRLNEAAQQHSIAQGAAGDIYHVAPDGTDPGDRISATGYTFRTWGENVAAGQRTAESVMTAWMNSSGHCKNILNPAFTEMGVGYVETSNSYRIWWTQKFARPSGVDKPAGTYNPAWC